MGDIIEILIQVLPGFEEFISYTEIVITAIPAYKVQIATSTFLILAIGALYLLGKHGLLGTPFGGGSDDDNW